MSTELAEKGEQGRAAAHKLGTLLTAEKNVALEAIATALKAHTERILEANRVDCDRGKEQGLNDGLIDRLMLNEQRINDMCSGIKTVIELPDPIGAQLDGWTLENGLQIAKVRVPIGVIGMIYEARPNVTVDASVLCLKAGNAVLLRGSSSALQSNKALVSVMQEALMSAGLPQTSVQLVEDPSRESVGEFLRLNRYLDVIIPRGGAGLIQRVVNESSVPVLETGAGVCHVYIAADAQFDMAEKIVVNAKTQRPSVCNAIETLLVDQGWAERHLSLLVDTLIKKGVQCRGCARTQTLVPGVVPATEKDWETEYLDLIISIKVVDDLNQAVDHINRFGTKHSESIVTDSAELAATFMAGVDAAAVYHNASTRFTDGSVFGFGAEIGISTQKLHARGPMGLPELTTYQYRISGAGQIRA